VDIIDELSWRGLLADTTDRDELRNALSSGRVTFYAGFDPTAPGLHIGNLALLLTMRRLQLAGHRPIGLVGGATGLIGDPSGKSAERVLNPLEVVAQWVERIRGEVSRFLDFDAGESTALIVSNLEWTGQMRVLDFLRDIGKHFSVNRMLDRESVRARLEAGGISYTEFSYQLLQAMDFLELYRRYGCALQLGGSDQWGNLVAGVDLIRRVESASVHALAIPLITDANGTKYGKTEGGAIWLSADLMSPYAFYQFWLNVADVEVPGLLRVFSFKSRDEIEALERETAERPAARAGQRALAEELTTLVHGAEEAHRVIAASRAAFGQAELAQLDRRTWAAMAEELPHFTYQPGLGATNASHGGPAPTMLNEIPAASEHVVLGARGPTIASVMVSAGIAPTLSAARRAIAEGGVYLNNHRVTAEDKVVTPADLFHDRYALVRRGKRTAAVLEWGMPGEAGIAGTDAADHTSASPALLFGRPADAPADDKCQRDQRRQDGGGPPCQRHRARGHQTTLREPDPGQPGIGHRAEGSGALAHPR
jgi:tyrosyl-tRNA synthetase